MAETWFGAPDIPVGIGPTLPMDFRGDVGVLQGGFAQGWLAGRPVEGRPGLPVPPDGLHGVALTASEVELWGAAFRQGQAARGLYDYQQASQEGGCDEPVR